MNSLVQDVTPVISVSLLAIFQQELRSTSQGIKIPTSFNI